MKVHLTVQRYIFSEDKLLLIPHAKCGVWLPVGGHVEEDETCDQAMKREAKEETNLNIKFLQKKELSIVGTTKENLAMPFYVNVHSVGDHNHYGPFYICRALNPEELNINKELNKFKWFIKEEFNTGDVPEDVKLSGKLVFEEYEKNKVIK